MTTDTETAPESDVPLFNVSVQLAKGVGLEDFVRMAEENGIAADRVDSLLKALRNGPNVRIGSGATMERANAAKDLYGKAGLVVDISPVLSIQTMTKAASDGSMICPACNKRIMLPANRQCPSCNIFVDKVTEEFLLKRKIMEQERARLENQMSRDEKDRTKRSKASMEAALRDQIREELEAEFGISNKNDSIFKGKKGLMRAAAIVGLAGVAFIGGQKVAGGNMPWNKSDTKVAAAAAEAASSAKPSANDSADKMLDSVGPPAGGAAGGAAAGSAGPGAEAGLTGDPDVDDPLIQAAGGKRVGAKGISMEQAVAAAQGLASAVGNTTAQRAMNAAGVGAAGGSGGGKAGAPGAAGSAGEAAAGGATLGPVPPATKLMLTADFAKSLAEMGQVARARQVLAGLKASPTLSAEPDAPAVVRMTDIEIQAWALQTASEGRIRQAAGDLKNAASLISDAAERAQAFTRIGTVLSRQAHMPSEAVRAFFTMAADSVKSIADPKARSSVTGDWAVGLAESQLSDAKSMAKLGMWNKASTAAGQVETLLKQAPDAWAQARLQAIDYQVKQLFGKTSNANSSLESALSFVGKNSNLVERAAWLQTLGHLSGAVAHEKFQAAVANTQSQAESKTGPEKAQVLKYLALLHADAGDRAKADQIGKLAQQAAAKNPAESAGIGADLVVRSDIAGAKAFHANGQYAEAERLVRQLGEYLF